jgi:aspartate aminotransferase-like enzyme
MIKEEGLENRWRRHEIIADAIRAGLEALNLSIVAEEGYRANTVTGFYTPEGTAFNIYSMMRERYKIHLAQGLGDLKGKILRMGHFGNITEKETVAILSALEMCLRAANIDVNKGSAVKGAMPYLEELT